MAVCAPKALAGGGSWVETKYGWQFEMDGGVCPKEQWMLIDDRWYYFDRNGYAVTGWKKIHGEYYYCLLYTSTSMWRRCSHIGAPA